MTGSKRRYLVAFLGLIMLSVSALAQVTVEEHWSPYDYPKSFPEGVKVHIIQKGDTLWDLSEQYFNNARLWPALYEANSYIQDPHLIYPGDPLRLDVGIVVDDAAITDDVENVEDDATASTDNFGELEDFAEGNGEEELVNDRSETTSFMDGSSEFVILPAGDRADMECSTYIYPASKQGAELPFDLIVAGSEYEDTELIGTGTVIYLSQGGNAGIAAGEEYSARRQVRSVYMPKKVGRGQFLGVAIEQVGRVRILAVQDESATGIVTDACTELLRGDFLVPYEQEPIPLITELPVANRWDEFDKAGHGTIVYSEDDVLAFGKGHLANATLGINDNVAPGDLFIIYRENPQNNPKKGYFLPAIYLGHGVALRTEDSTTVVKIIEGFKEMKVGDLLVPYNSNGFEN